MPPKCLTCATRVDQAHNLCPECWKDIHFISEPMCSCCGFPFGVNMGIDYSMIGESRCGACQKTDRAFDKAISAIRYDDSSRNMIIGFKHHDKLEYATFLPS